MDRAKWKEYVYAMISGRIPTQAEFVCPVYAGPAQAVATVQGDVLALLIRSRPTW
jgi:hypothetical protein